MFVSDSYPYGIPDHIRPRAQVMLCHSPAFAAAVQDCTGMLTQQFGVLWLCIMHAQVGVWYSPAFQTVDARGQPSWRTYAYATSQGPSFRLMPGEHTLTLCVEAGGDANIDKFQITTRTGEVTATPSPSESLLSHMCSHSATALGWLLHHQGLMRLCMRLVTAHMLQAQRW